MTYAYEALARIGGKPAGHCGTWINKSHYHPYPSSPGVIWKRVRVTEDQARAMHARQCSLETLVLDRMNAIAECEDAIQFFHGPLRSNLAEKHWALVILLCQGIAPT